MKSSKGRFIWDYIQSPQWRKGTGMLITGVPGSGKSTILRHITLCLSESTVFRNEYKGKVIPIQLTARELSALVEAYPQAMLGDVLEIYFSNPQEFPRLNPPPRWFEKQLTMGRCYVLIDGLDEVGDTEERADLLNWLNRQIRAYSESRFILTSRPTALQDAPLGNYYYNLRVLPFNNRQKQTFIEKWYQTAYDSVPVGLSEAVNRASYLQDQLRHSIKLNELAVNPLLLTMIVLTHQQLPDQVLPNSPLELYNQICEVLLDHLPKQRAEYQGFSLAEKKELISTLAALMMTLKRETLEIKEIYKALKSVLERFGRQNVLLDDITVILTELKATTSGLLQEPHRGEWGFAHLSFQEYLTANSWLNSKLPRQWQSKVNDSWWFETFRLYVARADATPVVKACLASGTLPALTLAVICLEAPYLEMAVRKELEQRLDIGLESENTTERRIAAEVRLARRLKDWYKLDGQREISVDYFSWSEYQLFLDDMYAQDKYCQPDYWKGLQFEPGTAKQPVVGIRDADAEAFSQWLSQRQQTTAEYQYRLPTSEEANQWMVENNPELTTWCKELSSKPVKQLEQDNSALVGFNPDTQKDLIQQLRNISLLSQPKDLRFRAFPASSFSNLAEALTYSLKSIAGYGAALASFKPRTPQTQRLIGWIIWPLMIVAASTSLTLLALSIFVNSAWMVVAFIELLGFALFLLTVMTSESILSTETNRKRAVKLILSSLVTVGLSIVRHPLVVGMVSCFAGIIVSFLFSRLLQEIFEFARSTMLWLGFLATPLLGVLSWFVLKWLIRPRRKKEISLVELVEQAINLVYIRQAYPIDESRAKSLALSLMTKLETFAPNSNLSILLRDKKFTEIKTLVESFKKSEVIPQYRIGLLLEDLLEAYLAENDIELRKTQYKYVARLVEYIYVGYQDLQQLRIISTDQKISREQKQLSEFYWWLQTTIARLENQLPAWESLRLVKVAATD